jgi:hypothetical protein
MMIFFLKFQIDKFQTPKGSSGLRFEVCGMKFHLDAFEHQTLNL